jgi:hypothetical protein
LYETTTCRIKYNNKMYLRSLYLMQMSGEQQLELGVLHVLQLFSCPYQSSAILFQCNLGKTVKICEGKAQYQLLDAVV